MYKSHPEEPWENKLKLYLGRKRFDLLADTVGHSLGFVLYCSLSFWCLFLYNFKNLCL